MTALDGHSARRDFLTYALSLMRAHHDEHSDTLPTMDVTALKHVAYVVDALIYYMRSSVEHDAELTMRVGGGSDDAHASSSPVHDWNDADDSVAEADADTDDAVHHSVAMEIESCDGDGGGAVSGGVGASVDWSNGRKHPFFHRSNSTSLLGCAAPDPFHTPLVDALPLAERPHLLSPNARKEDMFGMPRRTVADVSVNGSPAPFDRPPTHLGLAARVPAPSPTSRVDSLPASLRAMSSAAAGAMIC